MGVQGKFKFFSFIIVYLSSFFLSPPPCTMTYNQFERAVSVPRLQKYLTACHNDRKKARRLYRVNIHLSQKIFAVMSIFEVVLRNAIDQHYTAVKGNDWIA